MNVPCNVILDLIPLVKDGVASQDSDEIVQEHIESCESCRMEFEDFDTTASERPQIKDKRILAAIKHSIFVTQLVILLAGAVVGIALSDSMSMFYNFIIMPVIGGVSPFALKGKWYLALITVFLLTYLWQTIGAIVSYGLNWNVLHIGLFYSIIYTFLVGLGVVIAQLLKFSFKRESERDE